MRKIITEMRYLVIIHEKEAISILDYLELKKDYFYTIASLILKIIILGIYKKNYYSLKYDMALDFIRKIRNRIISVN